MDCADDVPKLARGTSPNSPSGGRTLLTTAFVPSLCWHQVQIPGARALRARALKRAKKSPASAPARPPSSTEIYSGFPRSSQRREEVGHVAGLPAGLASMRAGVREGEPGTRGSSPLAFERSSWANGRRGDEP